MVKKYLITFQFFVLFASCSLFNRGYTNSDGQYVPKRPNFDYKDKFSGQVPLLTDSNIVYKLTTRYYNGAIDSGFSKIQKSQQADLHYLKFYKNGRCLEFGIPANDLKVQTERFLLQNFNTSKLECSKSYFIYERNVVTIESFVFGDGTNMYVKSKYILEDDGKKLIFFNKNTSAIYEAIIVENFLSDIIFDW